MTNKLRYEPSQADRILMHDAVRHITSARLISRNIASDNKMPHFVQKIWTNVSAELSMAMQRIEDGIGRQNIEAFKHDFSNADSLAYHNIQDLIRRMSPKQLEAVEGICTSIVNGEEIKIANTVNETV